MAAALAGGCIDSIAVVVAALVVVDAAALFVLAADLAVVEHHQAFAFHWQ